MPDLLSASQAYCQIEDGAEFSKKFKVLREYYVLVVK
jgi:hypothetical protein